MDVVWFIIGWVFSTPITWIALVLWVAFTGFIVLWSLTLKNWDCRFARRTRATGQATFILPIPVRDSAPRPTEFAGKSAEPIGQGDGFDTYQEDL